MSRFAVRIEKLVRATMLRPRLPGRLSRIIVMHNLLLGDTVLLAPLLKTLALVAPEAERFVLARPAVLPLFSQSPYGVRAIPFARRDARSQRQILDSGPYDLAVIPDDNRYAWLARASGARHIIGFSGDRGAWKNWMVDKAIEYPKTPTAWADMMSGLMGATGVAPFVAGEWPAPSYTPFVLPGSPYVVLHIGASTPLKSWTAVRWRNIAERLRNTGYDVVWSGVPSERHILDEVDPPAHESILFGELDIAQLWHLLAQAKGLLCPDTGIAHLARLVGTPTVAMFGPGSALLHGAGEFWSEQPFQAVTVKEFPCRDQQNLYRRRVQWVRRCGRSQGIGIDQCPAPLCMAAIGEDEVWRVLSELLAIS